MRTRTAFTLMVVPLLALLATGCGSDDVAPPTVTAASVTPTQLPFAGGVLTITATVFTVGEIYQVTATVTGPGGPQTVPLAQDGDEYAGAFTAPVNGATTAANYTVTVAATDTKGQTGAEFAAGSFSVQPAAVPPQAPPGW